MVLYVHNPDLKWAGGASGAGHIEALLHLILMAWTCVAWCQWPRGAWVFIHAVFLQKKVLNLYFQTIFSQPPPYLWNFASKWQVMSVTLGPQFQAALLCVFRRSLCLFGPPQSAAEARSKTSKQAKGTSRQQGKREKWKLLHFHVPALQRVALLELPAGQPAAREERCDALVLIECTAQ